MFAAAVSTLSTVLQNAVGIAGTAVLARLLVPADFGLIALALTLFAFVGSLSDFGLPHAIVHHATFDPRHAAGLFRLNALLAGGLGLVMAASGPLVAWFYGQPRIVPLSVAVAAIVFLASVLNLHVAVMRRRMRFGVIALGDAVGLILGTLGAILAAKLGAGVWSLVVLLAGQQLGSAVLCWQQSRWRPTRERSPTYDRGDASGLRRYARHVALARVVANVGRNVDRVFVGSLAGSAATGLYQKAYQWSVLPVQTLHQPLLNVAVSALSRLQRRDVPRYRFAVRQALTLVLSVTMPVVALLFVEARAVIALLLGNQWASSVPYFRVLCVAGFAVGLGQATKWIYLCEGKTRRQLAWSVLSTPLMIAAVGGGAWVGRVWLGDAAMGVSCGFTLGTLVLLWPSISYCTADTHLRQDDLWRPAVRPAAASLAAAVASFFAFEFRHAPLHAVAAAPSYVRLPAVAAFFAVCFAAVWLALPGGRRALADSRDVIRLLRPGTKSQN